MLPKKLLTSEKRCLLLFLIPTSTKPYVRTTAHFHVNYPSSAKYSIKFLFRSHSDIGKTLRNCTIQKSPKSEGKIKGFSIKLSIAHS